MICDMQELLSHIRWEINPGIPAVSQIMFPNAHTIRSVLHNTLRLQPRPSERIRFSGNLIKEATIPSSEKYNNLNIKQLSNIGYADSHSQTI